MINESSTQPRQSDPIEPTEPTPEHPSSLGITLDFGGPLSPGNQRSSNGHSSSRRRGGNSPTPSDGFNRQPPDLPSLF